MGRPKQMLPVNGKPVVLRSIEAFLKVPSVKQIIVVTGPQVAKKIAAKYKNIQFAPAGKTRLESAINGLSLVGKNANLIAVHDGARPLVEPKDIKACLLSAAQNKAAILAAPVKDTIKTVKDGVVTQTLDRSVLYGAQTPQCYQTEILKKALEKYGTLKDATDESQLVEKCGVKVHIVVAGYKNLKITTPEDLKIAEALCKKEPKKK